MADKIRIGRDIDEYEPSDSEDDYSEEEKEILNEVRKGNKREQDEQQEVLAFSDSDDDDIGEMMGDSDIEGAGDDDDDIPDATDWGKNKRSYYNTDFVDPDFDTYTAEQEELAIAEEEEAKAIQQRLVQQMNEQDFELVGVLPSAGKSADSDEEQEAETAESSEVQKTKADFAGLTKRERRQLFEKDSPEFYGLMTDFENYYNDVEDLIQPVLKYVKENNVPFIPAFEFANLYQNLVLTYCINISFYLVLKSKRIPVKHHPLTERLVQIKKLLMQLQERYEEIIKPQLEALLERIMDGDKFEVLEVKPVTKKRQLDIMKAYKEPSKKAKQEVSDEETENDEMAGDDDEKVDGENEVEDDADDAEEVEDGDEEDARRGITYQIAKNKGLTPHRKKEQRNPRVKHRGKYRKALIRRKGAVRTVRKETKRYGGEISGIKATVSKSIKFKV